MAKRNCYWQEVRYRTTKSGERFTHGPYWYGLVDGRKKYFGKDDPRPESRKDLTTEGDGDDVGLACVILGVGLWQGRETAHKLYALALEEAEKHFPGNVGVRERIVKAWIVVSTYQREKWAKQEGETP